DRLEIDFTLKVGSVNQEVVVTAGEPLLQTQSADVGNVVDTARVNDLPLNGRRYADLALLEPGVQKFYAANNPAPDRFSVNGNLELQNHFGGTLGGPLIKNKTFFFGDFERFSNRQSTTVTSTVPTPLMKTGNFTELPYSLSDSSVTGQAGCVAGNIIQATSTTNQPCSD